METIIEKIIGVIETVWFELASILNLEEVGTFDSLQPFLANILSDPLHLGLTLAILMGIPYTIHKIKSAYRDKEKRLDALMQELAEEDIADSKPSFQNQSMGSPKFNQSIDKLDEEEYGNEFESPSSEKAIITPDNINKTPQEIFKNRMISDNDFGWESSPDEWDELYDYISKPFQIDKPKQESESTTAPKQKDVSTTVPKESRKSEIAPENLSQTPQEIFKNRRISDDDFGWETSVEEWNELYDYISKPFQVDKPKDDSSGEKVSPESKEEVSTEPSPKVALTENINQETEVPSNIGVDDLVEQIIEKVVSDNEETNKEPSNIGIEELATLIEDESSLDINKTTETLVHQEETTAGIDEEIEPTTEESSNIGIEELATLIEGEELDTSQIKSSPADNSEVETKASPPVRQRVELTLEEVEPELESQPALQTPIKEVEPELESQPALQTSIKEVASEIKTPSAGPLLNSMLNSSVSAKTDALVSKLKTFQSELETRFQSLEKDTEVPAETTSTTETLRKKQGDYQPANLSYQSKRKSGSNKEYLRQLESFIFMARQKNKKTDV